MIADELHRLILTCLHHAPTADQQRAVGAFCRFMTDVSPSSQPPVFILRGSAGTGKTTLAAAIVQKLTELKQKMVLLAPTGRAAKVLALTAGHPAYTIHRRIYRQRSAADLSAFNLNDNLHTDTLFIVDEASMIGTNGSNGNDGSLSFGTGNLLDDLVQYVYSGTRCRLMLIGDAAQLPPVGEPLSPALSADVLSAYGLTVHEANLNEVLRQAQTSGILYNATRLRRSLNDGETVLPKIQTDPFPDVTLVAGDELIEQLASSYSHAGLDDTIVITRSNKRANIYNQGIRRTILDREDELCRGDQLMIVKNNYYWSEKCPSLSYIANGDRCVVQRVRNQRDMHGFRFADVTLLFPDYDDSEMTATVILDTLTTDAPALTREQQQQLYDRVMADYADIPLKADRMKQVRQDPYFNALQVKFGYAVTCHKAQGGQWAHVYIDQGYMTDDMAGEDYLRWLYTAFTRATQRLFLVNWPQTQIQQNSKQ
ncbi:MAG: AAA family ATPase [Prevotella sp.]|nr:AAA family ATPase [Prevotella sp.]